MAHQRKLPPPKEEKSSLSIDDLLKEFEAIKSIFAVSQFAPLLKDFGLKVVEKEPTQMTGKEVDVELQRLSVLIPGLYDASEYESVTQIDTLLLLLTDESIIKQLNLENALAKKWREVRENILNFRTKRIKDLFFSRRLEVKNTKKAKKTREEFKKEKEAQEQIKSFEEMISQSNSSEGGEKIKQGYAEALVKIGTFYLGNYDLEKACEHFEKAIRANPDFIFYLFRAVALESAIEWNELTDELEEKFFIIENDLNESIRLKPNHHAFLLRAKLRLKRSSLLKNEEEFALALSDLEIFIRQGGAHVSLLSTLGHVHILSDTQLFSLHNMMKMMCGLVSLFVSDNKNDKKIERLVDLLWKLQQMHSIREVIWQPNFIYRIGEYYSKLAVTSPGKAIVFVDIFLAWVAQFPLLKKEKARLLYVKGFALFVLEQFEKARDLFSESLILAKDASVYLAKGNVLKKLNGLKEAVLNYELAYRLDPNLYQALVPLAQTYADLQEFSKAQGALTAYEALTKKLNRHELDAEVGKIKYALEKKMAAVNPVREVLGNKLKQKAEELKDEAITAVVQEVLNEVIRGVERAASAEQEVKKIPPEKIDEVRLRRMLKNKLPLEVKEVLRSHLFLKDDLALVLGEKENYIHVPLHSVLHPYLDIFSALSIEGVVHYVNHPLPGFAFILEDKALETRYFGSVLNNLNGKIQRLKEVLIHVYPLVVHAGNKPEELAYFLSLFSSALKIMAAHQMTPTNMTIFALLALLTKEQLLEVRRLELACQKNAAELELYGSVVYFLVMQALGKNVSAKPNDVDLLVCVKDVKSFEAILKEEFKAVEVHRGNDYVQFVLEEREKALPIGITVRQGNKKSVDPIPLTRHPFRFSGNSLLVLEDKENEVLKACQESKFTIEVPRFDDRVTSFFARVLKYYHKVRRDFQVDMHSVVKVLKDEEWLRDYFFKRFDLQNGARHCFNEIDALLKQGYFLEEDASPIVKAYFSVLFEKLDRLNGFQQTALLCVRKAERAIQFIQYMRQMGQCPFKWNLTSSLYVFIHFVIQALNGIHPAVGMQLAIFDPNRFKDRLPKDNEEKTAIQGLAFCFQWFNYDLQAKAAAAKAYPGRLLASPSPDQEGGPNSESPKNAMNDLQLRADAR